MLDSRRSRLVTDGSVALRGSGAFGGARAPERISQTETFRELAIAIAGMLTLAVLANLLVLSL
jgi:hypothetical protein